MIPNFDWDLAKARENEQKHGVTFEEAATVFADYAAVFDDDPGHSDEEDRFIIIGISARERIADRIRHSQRRRRPDHQQPAGKSPGEESL